MEKLSRSMATKQRRRNKLAALFEGKRFTIISEIHRPPGEVYQTPLGSRGRDGWLVQDEADESVKYCVGPNLLRIMAEDFGAVDLPEGFTTLRTRNSKK